MDIKKFDTLEFFQIMTVGISIVEISQGVAIIAIGHLAIGVKTVVT